jgi:hypothetical protein
MPYNLSCWRKYYKIVIYRNFHHVHLLEVGLTQIPEDHAPLSIVRHVELHVDFSSTNFLGGFRPSPPSVKWTWTVSAFSTNESSYIAMVKGLQPCVWSGPKLNSMPTLRATSHMSQEPWPCNGDDPWLSSKGCTMGVSKAVSCSHGPSSIVWSESGPCCMTITYFVGIKRGEDLV